MLVSSTAVIQQLDKYPDKIQEGYRTDISEIKGVLSYAAETVTGCLLTLSNRAVADTMVRLPRAKT